VGSIAEPLTAALLSAALLGERMTAPGVAGAVLLVAAMAADPVADAWARRRSRPRVLPRE
jgi:DME family drug/metabolite transporter